jgi:hypothetical protein
VFRRDNLHLFRAPYCPTTCYTFLYCSGLVVTQMGSPRGTAIHPKNRHSRRWDHPEALRSIQRIVNVESRGFTNNEQTSRHEMAEEFGCPGGCWVLQKNSLNRAPCKSVLSCLCCNTEELCSSQTAEFFCVAEENCSNGRRILH